MANSFSRDSKHHHSKSISFALPDGPDGRSHSTLDHPQAAWQPPEGGFFSIPAQFYDRYEDMFALKQDDFYLTGFEPDSLDP